MAVSRFVGVRIHENRSGIRPIQTSLLIGKGLGYQLVRGENNLNFFFTFLSNRLSAISTFNISILFSIIHTPTSEFSSSFIHYVRTCMQTRTHPHVTHHSHPPHVTHPPHAHTHTHVTPTPTHTSNPHTRYNHTHVTPTHTSHPHTRHTHTHVTPTHIRGQ